MITLTLTAPSHQELRAQMREFLGMDKETGPQPAPHEDIKPQMSRAEKFEAVDDSPVSEPMLETAKTFTPEADPPKRKRRTKAEIEAAKSNGHTNIAAPTPEISRAEEAPVKQPASIAAPIVSKEAAHQALQQVNVAVGLPKAREILTSFSAQRISDVKEADYKALIEKCNEAVMLA